MSVCFFAFTLAAVFGLTESWGSVVGSENLTLRGSASLNDKLIVDFGGNGLWGYDGSNWSQLTTLTPDVMAKWMGGIAVDLSSSGLWSYNGSSWDSLTTNNPQQMVGWSQGLAADFGGFGLWNYDGSTWSPLTTWNPEAMEAWSGGLAVDFGASGLWNYDGSTWTLLTTHDAEAMKAWSGGLAVDFGTFGLWNYDGTNWTLLTTYDATMMQSWDGGLAVDFSSGLWSYDDSSWTFLTASHPEGMKAWSNGLATDLGTSGLWSYDGSSWSLLTTQNAQAMEGWVNGLAVDLGGAGFWTYDGANWSQLTTWDAFDSILANSIIATGGYQMYDLDGQWEYEGLISGDSPSQTPGWYYGDWNVAGNGEMSTSTPIVNSLGNNNIIPASYGSFSISADGIVSIPENQDIEFHGVMNASKDVIAYTATMAPGNLQDVHGYNLGILIKKGASYSDTDLGGQWEYIGLISGDSPDETPGWYYGDWSLTGNGPITDSLGNDSYVPDIPLAISADGIVSIPENPDIQFHGIMNSSKDMIVSTSTMTAGDKGSVSGYNLAIFVKTSTSYSLSDLKGTWYAHGLTTGDNPQWTGWMHGSFIVDENGNIVSNLQNSDGETNSPAGTISITSDGVVTLSGVVSHGVMNDKKDTIVITMNDGGGGYDLLVLLKPQM